MQNQLNRALLSAALLLAAPMVQAQWRTLNIPLTTQEHSQWCWSASSKAVINYYRTPPSQCQIVNWAYGINYACGNSTFNWNSYANQPNSLYGSNGSVQSILSAWGVPNYAYGYASTWNTVVTDINNNRPFVIRVGWRTGGGHIKVGRGYETYNGTNYVYIMDPWPGEGQVYQTYSYAVASSEHNWTHTLRVTR